VRGSHGPSCDERRSRPMGGAFAGRWPSLHASLAVAGCPARIRGSSPPTLSVLRRRERTSRPSLSFGALADRPGRTTDRAHLRAWAWVTFLSWDPSAQDRHVPVVRAIRPSIDITVSVHSHAACPPRFGQRGATLASPVPPAWFRTTSAVSSAPGFAGLLHPAADPGVRCVSRTAPGCHRSGPGTHARSPQRGFGTPRRTFPADSRTASPRPLPPCRWYVVRDESRRRPRLRGFAPSSGPRPHRTVAGTTRPDPSWALFPFEVFLPPAGAPRSLLWSTFAGASSRKADRTPQLRSAPRG
jgi:hypothetical protein